MIIRVLNYFWAILETDRHLFRENVFQVTGGNCHHNSWISSDFCSDSVQKMLQNSLCESSFVLCFLIFWPDDYFTFRKGLINKLPGKRFVVGIA